VAAGVADRLGFTPDKIVWTTSSFSEGLAEGPKEWDINIQQFTITAEREKTIDFSTPYFTGSQAVLTREGGSIIGATSLNDLKDATFAAQADTTSLTAVTDIIAPTTEPVVCETSADVMAALSERTVDAIVVDLPTAIWAATGEIGDGVVVGQLESTGDSADQLGLVLPEGSPMTEPVSATVDSLRDDGTLDQLATTWLGNIDEVPVLT
jgi:polar amino acid transport system substrate-binding protein